MEESVEANGPHIDASDFIFQQEPDVPAELQEGLKPEELEQSHPGGALWSDSLGEMNWEFENRESLVVNGQVITASSSMRMLRTCAEFVGISKGGSKASLWKRLNQAVGSATSRASGDVRNSKSTLSRRTSTCWFGTSISAKNAHQ